MEEIDKQMQFHILEPQRDIERRKILIEAYKEIKNINENPEERIKYYQIAKNIEDQQQSRKYPQTISADLLIKNINKATKNLEVEEKIIQVTYRSLDYYFTEYCYPNKDRANLLIESFKDICLSLKEQKPFTVNNPGEDRALKYCAFEIVKLSRKRALAKKENVYSIMECKLKMDNDNSTTDIETLERFKNFGPPLESNEILQCYDYTPGNRNNEQVLTNLIK